MRMLSCMINYFFFYVYMRCLDRVSVLFLWTLIRIQGKISEILRIRIPLSKAIVTPASTLQPQHYHICTHLSALPYTLHINTTMSVHRIPFLTTCYIWTPHAAVIMATRFHVDLLVKLKSLLKNATSLLMFML
jgi:hypothetical protein